MRVKPDELIVDDDDAVVAWAEGNDVKTIVRLKKVIDRKALRAYLETAIPADLQPPGVRLKARDDEFYVTPAEPDHR